MVEKRSYDRLVARIEALARRVSELCRRQDKTLQHWLDNEEVCLLLNIQKRTLQRYRERGLLPVAVIDKDLSDRMASTIRHNRARS